MAGDDNGPEIADGDLTGDVDFTLGEGCAEFDYGYTPVEGGENTAPTAAAEAIPATAAAGQQVELDASGSDDAETPDDLDYSWDFGNGGSDKDAAGKVVRHAYRTAGNYTATVTVTDPAGATDTASVDVTVTGDVTDPEATMSMTPGSPDHRQRVTLSGRGSTDDTTSSRDLVYRWNFGDGGAGVDATGRNVTTQFGRPGFRTVRLTVIDEAGNRDTVSRRILVRRYTPCQNDQVTRTGSWRTVRGGGARGGSYCENQGRGPGKDVVTYTFRGPRLLVLHGASAAGGVARVVIDGRRRTTLSFHNQQQRVRVDDGQLYRGLGKGRHTVRIVVRRGEAYLEGFITHR